MITKEEAIKLAEEYLKKRKRDYIEIVMELVNLKTGIEIGYGLLKDEIRDVWVVAYSEQGNDPIYYFIQIEAETGRVLCTLGPHSYVEDWEKEGFEE